MRTNKECPLYKGTGAEEIGIGRSSRAPVQVAVTEEQEEELEKEDLEDHGLIGIEGTKLKINKKLITQ